jgi:hypothetical protein
MLALAETTCWGGERSNNGETLGQLSELLPIASLALFIQHTAVDHDAYPLADTFWNASDRVILGYQVPCSLPCHQSW